jgi:beta-glucanase (GH16 family)
MVTTRAQGGSMKYKFKQGYAEARVKAPKGNPYWSAFWLVSPNDGSTPGWPDYGEFDIFELYGARPDITTGTLHYGCTKSGGHCQTSPTWYNIKTDSAYGGTSTLGTQLTTQSAADSYSGGTADYQVYGFLWEANKISWYVNGRKFRYFDGTNVYRIEQNGSQTLENSTSSLGTPSTPFGTVFGYDHSIILNLAFGGNGYDSSSGYTNGNLAAVLPGNMDVDYVRVYQLETASSTTPATNPSPSPSSGSSSGSGSTAPSSTSSSSGGTNTTSGSTSTTNSSNSTTSSGTTASSTKPSTSTPPVTPGTAAVPIVVTKPNQTVAGTAVLSPTLSPTVTNTAVQKTIVKVDYLVDDKLQASDTAAPYGLDTTKLAEGAHAVTEKVSYQNGTTTQTTGKIVVDNKTASQEKKAQNMQLYAVSSGLGLATLVLLAVPITRSMIWYTLSYAPKKYLLHR